MRTRVVLVGMLCLCLAAALGADMRTKTIRLVPESDFDLNAQPIRVVVEANVRHEKLGDLVNNLEEAVDLGLEKLGYTLDDQAPLELRLTIDYLDFGSRTKRLLTGSMLGGKGHIEGQVALTLNGNSVGRFNYSSRLRGGITAGSLKSMAKEVGPPLVLKLDGTDRDTELHERPQNKKPAAAPTGP